MRTGEDPSTIVRRLVALALALAVSSSVSAGAVYDWTGVCDVSYCDSGDPAIGTLTLADSYVPGTYTTDPDDFVSFSYAYYRPTYQDDPSRVLVTGTVTKERLGRFNWIFDPTSDFAIVQCDDCPPGEPSTGDPIVTMGFVGTGYWDIPPKASGFLTSFALRSQPVPEPGSLTPLIFGISALILLRLRRAAAGGTLTAG